jgi:UDP-N-acetylglucosamine--N-acetylmuramyl-(pentapeptide) pyrophosphoryl-undecaprenol N-acetylglucosamine transferase
MHCFRLLREFRPDVVVGVGGYASGPMMLAAILSRVPTLAYEPNAFPGMVNRLVGKYVTTAAVNFEATRSYFRRSVVTGIPVRPEFFAIPPRPDLAETDTTKLNLLVFGGSLGARFLNRIMPKVAAQLLRSLKCDVNILHQTGAAHYESTLAEYQASGADPAYWVVVPYLDDMAQQFADADLILCRSGATTVAELAASGRASLLVPFPQATDDHQRRNAEVLVQAGGAAMLTEADIYDASVLLSELVLLLNEHRRRHLMAIKVKMLAHPDALQRIGQMVVALASKQY